MKIGLNLLGLKTFNRSGTGLVQGEELVAFGWQKYLLRKDGVEEVVLSKLKSHRNDLDIIIHFNPFLKISDKVKNILYMQNAFPEPFYDGGTIEVFNTNKSKFDGFIFISKKQMKECCSDGVVVPFATDSERFYPQYVTEGSYHQVAVSFVGNNHRREECFRPALGLGLKVWGKEVWSSSFELACQGFLPLEDMPLVYTNSKINLDVHLPDHNYFGVINERVFSVLACGGFLISDSSWGVQEIFGDSVVIMEVGGNNLSDKIEYYLENIQERSEKASKGREIVLNNHTYKHRVEIVLNYVKEIL